MNYTWLKIKCAPIDLNLKFTLSGGQCFRWRETRPGEWTGVVGRQVWRLRWSEPACSAPGLELRVWPAPSSTQAVEATQRALAQYLQLDTELTPLYELWASRDPHFKRTASAPQFQGIRMLRQEPLENIFSFICSSNNNISRISSMVERLCTEFGEKICSVEGQQYHSFPSLETLAGPNVEAALRKASFGYRAPFVVGTARQILEAGGESWARGLRDLDYPQAKLKLMALPGIGAKVADCICLMSLGHLQAVPVDTHVYQIACQRYTPHLAGRKSLTTRVYDEISAHFHTLYGPLAGWAHTVLFCADLKLPQEKKGQSEDSVPAKKKRKK